MLLNDIPLQMLSMAVLPESPVWLLWKGNKEEAAAAQKRLLGEDWQSSTPEAESEEAPLFSSQEASVSCPPVFTTADIVNYSWLQHIQLAKYAPSYQTSPAVKTWKTLQSSQASPRTFMRARAQEMYLLGVSLQAESADEQHEKGWAELASHKYRWIMLLATLLPLFQQLSGINTCILYSSQACLWLLLCSLLCRKQNAGTLGYTFGAALE